MSYTHFSIVERSKLELLRSQGAGVRTISRVLGRSAGAVSRELRRNGSSERYEAQEAQQAYANRRTASKPNGKWNPNLASEIESDFKKTHSPEQIASSRKAKGLPTVAFKTLYNWLYTGRLNRGDLQVLRHKGKRRKPPEKRGRFTLGLSIRQRPKAIRSRETFGHWELDTVVSSRGKSKACVATFVERKTRFYQAIKMPNRTALSMEIAFGVLAAQYPKAVIQTATVDRGKEFACHAALKQIHGVEVYFADPYSSWQRGSNENANGLLREFFPKGHDFAEVSDAELQHALHLINSRPRKCLGWRSTHESFQNELLHLD
ncbi:IS30 family transposase [Saccharibacillus sp. CPCC 101409]|uniref:IS30 family transposase n=1 Tax=Saccharibacillus sp. CPCC 101409 TaxID=3058041 RepID=UPI0026721C78|nr:IS30 family transposase [Saccharibacillus sp. CPCC 101409]MDO3413416.1 IS30 family transposase [Saccharibacillus sp. CPCC 101409]